MKACIVNHARFERRHGKAVESPSQSVAPYASPSCIAKRFTTESFRISSCGLPFARERRLSYNMASAKGNGASPDSPGTTQPAWKSPLVRAVLLAQVLSLLLCVMGTTSGLLAGRGVNMPTTQSFFNYLLLALTCGAYQVYKRGFRLSNPLWIYLLLAVLDVEANFLVTKAYQYTSVTSVTLLDCFTIPAVMALSAAFLRARFSSRHYLGAALCLGGLVVLVATDRTSATGGPDPVLGDVLVLAGAVLYACSNVAQEALLLGATPVSELLAAVGAAGAVLGGLQAFLLERGAWGTADWSQPWATAGPLAGFALALYTFALLLPRVLIWGGATVLNLSLLTSDVWAAGARVVFFGGFGGTAGWFVAALLAESVGLLVYTLAGQTHPHPDLQGRGGEGGGGQGGGVGEEVEGGRGRYAGSGSEGVSCFGGGVVRIVVDGGGRGYQRLSSVGGEEGVEGAGGARLGGAVGLAEEEGGTGARVPGARCSEGTALGRWQQREEKEGASGGDGGRGGGATCSGSRGTACHHTQGGNGGNGGGDGGCNAVAVRWYGSSTVVGPRMYGVAGTEEEQRRLVGGGGRGDADVEEGGGSGVGCEAPKGGNRDGGGAGG